MSPVQQFGLYVEWMSIVMAILHKKRFHCFIEGAPHPAEVTGTTRWVLPGGPKLSENSWPMPKSQILSWWNGFVWTCIVLLLTYNIYKRVGFYFTFIFKNIKHK